MNIRSVDDHRVKRRSSSTLADVWLLPPDGAGFWIVQYSSKKLFVVTARSSLVEILHLLKMYDRFCFLPSLCVTQDPHEADKLLRIQKELDETKIILVRYDARGAQRAHGRMHKWRTSIKFCHQPPSRTKAVVCLNRQSLVL